MAEERREAKRVSKDLAEDPNYVAYQQALESGQFANLEPGTFVVFHEGQLVLTGTDRDKIFEELGKRGIGGFIHQVNISEEPIVLHGFFVDSDGNLHRGIPTWVYDDEGNEHPVNLEWGTNIVYPREE
ncbi:hypothetical protein HYU90_03385 [Candidatus Collierbacteria bacterium]|nr:hypothetical protein [Candidatus Collierbacteria bacterium]